MQIVQVPPSSLGYRDVIRRLLVALDLGVAAGCLFLIGMLVRWRLIATHDEFEIEAFIILSAPVLITLAGFFSVAAVAQWRAYRWRWLAQWSAFGAVLFMLAAAAYLSL